ncbi:MAG: HAD family hydrolase [Candidatus Aquicultorales bacterium]
MLKAVFFDAGNTLLYPHPGVPQVCTEVFSRLGRGASLETVREAVGKAEAFYEDRYKADDMFWASEPAAADFWYDYYLEVANHCGVDGIARKAAREIYDEFGKADRWRLFPDVLPALELLKSAGMKLGIISNWDTRLSRIVLSLGIGGYFDFVISSACVGFIKPQARIFELALERAEVGPDEAVHVGDHFYADVLGAGAAGIEPILLQRTARARPKGTRVVSDLAEVCDLIARSRALV